MKVKLCKRRSGRRRGYYFRRAVQRMEYNFGEENERVFNRSKNRPGSLVPLHNQPLLFYN